MLLEIILDHNLLEYQEHLGVMNYESYYIAVDRRMNGQTEEGKKLWQEVQLSMFRDVQ